MERSVLSLRCRVVAAEPLPTVAPPASLEPRAERSSFHRAVEEFKRSLIEDTLRRTEWNRTHAAKFLGLQRTYLLRLMRDLQVKALPPRGNGRSLVHATAAQERRETKRV